MSMQQDEITVVRTVTIDASPETVFPFLTDPGKMIRWKGTSADLDARVGGAYHVDVTPTAVAVCEYLEIDPPSRVVLAWGWRGSDDVPPRSSRVEVVLEPQDGGTLLTLTHSGLPSEHSAQEHTHGWDHYLARLAIAAPGGDPGEDPMLSADMSQDR